MYIVKRHLVTTTLFLKFFAARIHAILKPIANKYIVIVPNFCLDSQSPCIKVPILKPTILVRVYIWYSSNVTLHSLTSCSRVNGFSRLSVKAYNTSSSYHSN